MDWGPFRSNGERNALEALGFRLLRARARSGLTQRELSRRCGVPQSTISRLEHALARTASVRNIALILLTLQELEDNRSGRSRNAFIDGPDGTEPREPFLPGPPLL